MTDPAEAFTRITAEFGDLHGLAVEGHAGDQPPECIAVLAAEISNGLHRVRELLACIHPQWSANK